ncbi:cation diffusion facilitator family transporter [Zhihengliuella halotolerans]|uniref:cation diffusion facilitator family transporter n=1 Tax=Zhihengliuella halotolerans TaxID=370736 RepID=UPI000C7FCFF2|nr:cation transporter [Zhihengliuella halotolerans]
MRAMTGQQHQLPEDARDKLARAVRLEWITLGYLVVTVTLVTMVMGNSQAMKTAWVEDLLSAVPQIAFLSALMYTRHRRNPKHPYGYHRATGVGHLVSGVTLAVVGAIMAYESASGLLKAEHPAIGTVQLLGHTVWLGWLMVAVMAVIAAPAVILGRLKAKAAGPLHNKLLYADADMAKADWTTNVASIIGVLGVGVGLWWLDYAAALAISAGILKDGAVNTRNAVLGLLDARATTYDNRKPDPMIGEIEAAVGQLPWVREAAARVRDMGMVFHIEVFVVPRGAVGLDQTEEALASVEETGWKAHDVVVVPVRELPDYLFDGAAREE